MYISRAIYLKKIYCLILFQYRDISKIKIMLLNFSSLMRRVFADFQVRYPLSWSASKRYPSWPPHKSVRSTRWNIKRIFIDNIKFVVDGAFYAELNAWIPYERIGRRRIFWSWSLCNSTQNIDYYQGNKNKKCFGR